MNPPSLDEIAAFVAVAEAGGFTSASKRLALTTNAVSLRVQRLEFALGVGLFVRTTRSVALTDEGKRYLERVAPILLDLDAARDEVRGEGAGLRGTVRIAVPSSIATEGLLARLRMLLDEHPRLVVQTRVTNTPIDIAAEGVDIALVVGQPAQTSFVGRLLGRPSWVLVAAPSYLKRYGRPKSSRDLRMHRCLMFLSSPPQKEWVLVDRRGREVTVPVSGGYEADDSRTLGDAAYAGLGIGVRPLDECIRAVKAKRLERVLPQYRTQPLDVYALLPQGRIRLPRVAACLEALREAVADVS